MTPPSGSDPADKPSPPRNRSERLLPQFTIGGMLLVTFVFCVIASAGYYLARTLQGGQNARLAFTLFTLAAPVVLVVFVSIAYSLLRPRRRRSR